MKEKQLIDLNYIGITIKKSNRMLLGDEAIKQNLFA